MFGCVCNRWLAPPMYRCLLTCASLPDMFSRFFNSLCVLLRCGAMDAEAYSGISNDLIRILWSIGTSKKNDSEHLWVKARGTAFHSLSHYKVMLRLFVPCVTCYSFFFVKNPVPKVCKIFWQRVLYRSQLFKMLFLISGSKTMNSLLVNIIRKFSTPWRTFRMRLSNLNTC